MTDADRDAKPADGPSDLVRDANENLRRAFHGLAEEIPSGERRQFGPITVAAPVVPVPLFNRVFVFDAPPIGSSSVVPSFDRWTYRRRTSVSYERTFTVEEGRQFVAPPRRRPATPPDPDDEGRVMVPGLLAATMPTKLGGDREVPSPRTEFEFRQPVYTGESITCRGTHDTAVERDDGVEFTRDVVCDTEAGEVVLAATIDGLVRRDT